MTYVLAFSLVLNVLLAGSATWLWTRRRWGRPLPRTRPDFAAVERAARVAVGDQPPPRAFEVQHVAARQWLGQVWLRHTVDDVRPHQGSLQGVVDAVSRRCQVPGRVAGSFGDPDRPALTVGTILEFGYSVEVGYRHTNEFAPERAASAIGPDDQH